MEDPRHECQDGREVQSLKSRYCAALRNLSAAIRERPHQTKAIDTASWGMEVDCLRDEIVRLTVTHTPPRSID